MLYKAKCIAFSSFGFVFQVDHVVRKALMLGCFHTFYIAILPLLKKNCMTTNPNSSPTS